MLFIGLVLMGIFSYKHLPMELYPNAELPVLSVSISSETESDPSYIENQVARFELESLLLYLFINPIQQTATRNLL